MSLGYVLVGFDFGYGFGDFWWVLILVFVRLVILWFYLYCGLFEWLCFGSFRVWFSGFECCRVLGDRFEFVIIGSIFLRFGFMLIVFSWFLLFFVVCFDFGDLLAGYLLVRGFSCFNCCFDVGFDFVDFGGYITCCLVDVGWIVLFDYCWVCVVVKWVLFFGFSVWFGW